MKFREQTKGSAFFPLHVINLWNSLLRDVVEGGSSSRSLVKGSIVLQSI